MKTFVKACASSFGRTTNIYFYVNPEHIVECHIEKSQYEVNIEAQLITGERVIIQRHSDLKLIVGEKIADELLNEIKEMFEIDPPRKIDIREKK